MARLGQTGPWRRLLRFPGCALSSLSLPVCPQVALAVFAVHSLVAEENAMDAEKAFVTLVVLNILNKAQGFLPFSIDSVVRVRRWGGQAIWAETRRGVAGSALPLCIPTLPTGPTGEGGRGREGQRIQGMGSNHCSLIM